MVRQSFYKSILFTPCSPFNIWPHGWRHLAFLRYLINKAKFWPFSKIIFAQTWQWLRLWKNDERNILTKTFKLYHAPFLICSVLGLCLAPKFEFKKSRSQNWSFSKWSVKPFWENLFSYHATFPMCDVFEKINWLFFACQFYHSCSALSYRYLEKLPFPFHSLFLLFLHMTLLVTSVCYLSNITTYRHFKHIKLVFRKSRS